MGLGGGEIERILADAPEVGDGRVEIASKHRRDLVEPLQITMIWSALLIDRVVHGSDYAGHDARWQVVQLLKFRDGGCFDYEACCVCLHLF